MGDQALPMQQLYGQRAGNRLHRCAWEALRLIVGIDDDFTDRPQRGAGELQMRQANGMPMMVIAKSTAVMRWPSASHQPASTSQIRLPAKPQGSVARVIFDGSHPRPAMRPNADALGNRAPTGSVRYPPIKVSIFAQTPLNLRA